MTGQNIPDISQLRTVVSFLTTLIQVLGSRIDIQVTASTETNADYAAEVVDGRVDVWDNENASLGTNIRNGQERLALGLRLIQESFQSQLDEEAEARINLADALVQSNEARRQDVLTEEELRVADDDSLQTQINELSNAILKIAIQISEIRRKLA